jgi:hypothetical protein
MTTTQTDLFEPTIAQRFAAWKLTPGAGLILREFYRLAARYYRRYQIFGLGVSQRLIEEKVRDAIRLGEVRGVKENGYALNSHFTKPILEHMLHEHPEWAPMFEVRSGFRRRVEETIVVRRKFLPA